MTTRIFLPIRRDDQVLIFEHRERREQRRWDFFAVAVSTPDGLRRTGNGALTPEEMAECERLVALLPRLDEALENNRLTDISPDRMGLAMDKDLAIIDGSPLMTVALYLHLKRDILVVEGSLQRYLDRTPEDRFDVGMTASVYASQLRVHRLEGASKMIDADMQVAESRDKTHREWAYLFNQAAELKRRSGQHQDAIDLSLQVLDRWPSADLWRRIGNLYFDVKDIDSAIDSFLKADAMSPLQGPAALRVAHWLAQKDRAEEARNYAEVASRTGAPNASVLLERLDTAD